MTNNDVHFQDALGHANIRNPQQPFTTEAGRNVQLLRNIGRDLQATQTAYQIKENQAEPGFRPEDLADRPLSDDLGYFRILRTSTLVAVGEVCCVDC